MNIITKEMVVDNLRMTPLKQPVFVEDMEVLESD